MHGLLRTILRLQDWICRLGFFMGAVALAAIVASYAFEVVMRYFFNSPTRWASDAVSFLLLISVFLVAPWLTRERGNVAVTLLPDLLSQRMSQLSIRIGYGISAIVCFVAGFIASGETIFLFNRGTMTYSAIPFPKWVLISVIAFGLLGSGTYFLRLAFAKSGQETLDREDHA